jgi:penicillin-binding protein 2
MRSMMERSATVPKFMGFPLKKNLTFEEVSLLASATTELKGISVEARPYRHYPMGETLCHVLGTLGEISPAELGKVAQSGYRTGDLVGKTGIELEYESHLRGQEGWEQIEIDAKGRQLATLNRKAPEGGSELVLTVDASLQKFVEENFVERAGSVVAIDPDTGKVLCMVSKPGFDLNLFTPAITERDWKKLLQDPLHPLENRSIRGLYAPGSTFKIVTASAALAEKAVTPQRAFTCKGFMEVANQTFRCWNQYGHGKVSLHRGLVESCDVYFYELGLRLGADRIAKYASLFGFGTPSGLGLPQELPGLIPTSAWKRRTYGDFIKDGETMAIAIGQGYVVSTPIQLAVMTAAMANGGKVMKPAIVERIVAPDGKQVFEHVPVVRWEIPVESSDRTLIKAALRDVVDDQRGTGKKCRIPGIKVEAKTGTSQVISTRQRTEEGQLIPYHERTHALFVAYVEDRPKKIALVVIVEHGGGGGASAAPIARKVICRYYDIPDPGDPQEDR